MSNRSTLELTEIDIGQQPDAAAVLGIGGEALQLRRRWDGQVFALEMNLDGFLNGARQIVPIICRRKAAGEIRESHAVGVGFIAGMNVDGIVHRPSVHRR